MSDNDNGNNGTSTSNPLTSVTTTQIPTTVLRDGGIRITPVNVPKGKGDSDGR